MKRLKEDREVFGRLAIRIIRLLMIMTAAVVGIAAVAGHLRHALPGGVMMVLLLADAGFVYAGVFLIRKFLVVPYENSRALFRRFAQDEIYQELLDSPYRIFEEQQMVLKHFDSLLDQKNMIQLSTKQAELLALQNQINPHFLYNTLEAIRGDALCAGLDSIANTTEALATFFRYTITETGNLVTVQDELDNIDNYFKIQQYRFGEKFTMNVNFPPDDDVNSLLSLKLPKLTLQPLIENAIFHGLESKAEGGSIDIGFETSASSLLISIRDDGIGIPEEKLAEINYKLEHLSLHRANENSGQKGGIALFNVARRIKLLFGEDYGFHIYSISGLGTDVKIKIPIIR
jgi:Predicted signal transduction protein with a C-terminal ATPase domain